MHQHFPKPAIYDFWIKNNLNVLFIGKAGIGKTETVKEKFNEHFGKKWMYISASTMDPWVDLIGVPREITDPITGESYLDLIRPKQIVDGEVEAIMIDEYNRCVAGDTKIALTDGRHVEIRDLVGVDEFFVYAYDQKSREIKIARGHSARKTVKNEKLLKITLDNGRSFKCTVDHPILNFDGKFVRADSLRKDNSLLPLYRFWDNKKKNLSGYEWVWQPKKNSKWVLTYHMADEYNTRNDIYAPIDGEHRHHVDFNKNNNSPKNIVRLSSVDHFKIHNNSECAAKAGAITHINHPDLYQHTLATSESRKKAIFNSVNTRQTSKEYKTLRSNLSKKMYTHEMCQYRSDITKKQWQTGQFSSIDRKAALHKNHIMRIINAFSEFNVDIDELDEVTYDEFRLQKKLNTCMMKSSSIISKYGNFTKFKEIAKELMLLKNNGNHKIVSIEECDNEDVYDITVDEYENFAIDCGIFVHNSPAKVRNAIMELIQFRSINGKKFNNLKIVWAAINPDDDDTYDVERLDPAQKDRFPIHVYMPYEVSYDFFVQKFGSMGRTACQWWDNLSDEVKNELSPRRLDYALQVFKMQGDLTYVLPYTANVQELTSQLMDGSIDERLNALFLSKNEEECTEAFMNENFLTGVDQRLNKNKEYKEFFIQFYPKDRLVARYISDNEIRDYFYKNVNYRKYQSIFDPIIVNYENNEKKINGKEVQYSVISSLKRWRKQYITVNELSDVDFINTISDYRANVEYITKPETQNDIINRFGLILHNDVILSETEYLAMFGVSCELLYVVNKKEKQPAQTEALLKTITWIGEKLKKNGYTSLNDAFTKNLIGLRYLKFSSEIFDNVRNILISHSVIENKVA